MRVYRITKPEYVGVALIGYGAMRSPGRWNSVGVRVGYTASSISLAMLEMLAHLDREDAPTDRRLLTYEVPDDAIETLSPPFPEGWDQIPYSAEVRATGNKWILAGSSLALEVPSAVARRETNILINPTHARFSEIKLIEDEALAMDPRLFK